MICRVASLAALLLAPAVASAGETISGPIVATVVSVYDGDTLTVDAHPWPGVTIRTAVRVDGVDTPEIRGKCEAEKVLAVRARDLVRVTVGRSVVLSNVRLGKYAGRVLADVGVGQESVAGLLIAQGLARPYRGGRRQGWCG